MTSRFDVVAMMLLAPLLAVGCGSYTALMHGGGAGGAGAGPSANSAATADADASPSEPRVVTDLSQLSSSNPLAQLQQRQLLAGQSTPQSSQPSNQTVSNIERFYIANQKTAQLIEAPLRPPGDARLVNAKAAQYPEFAYDIANRTLAVAQDMAPQKLEQHRLPEDIKPIVLTAVMTAEGKLTDIYIEHRSGFSAVDQLFIDACKKGIWARNPPPAALSSDGSYRLRIEGVIYNYSYNHENQYTYATYVGLGLL